MNNVMNDTYQRLRKLTCLHRSFCALAENGLSFIQNVHKTRIESNAVFNFISQ